MEPTYLVLASPGAGSTADDALDDVLTGLGGRDRARVVEVGSAESLAAALDGADGATLVVAGGDGSLHHTLRALHARGELDRPVGLVPLGTGNDFARSVGLPVDDPAAAAERVRTGSPRTLDLLSDSAGGVVVNAVHLGAGADGAERSARLKGRLGPLAYPVGAVLAGVRPPRWRLRVEVDGVPLAHGRLLQAAVGNGATVGGGTPLLPDADPGDGSLDVLTAEALPLHRRLGYGLAVRFGRQAARDDVTVRRGRSVTITTLGSTPVPVANDGELEELTGSRTWTVLPGAWQLLC